MTWVVSVYLGSKLGYLRAVIAGKLSEAPVAGRFRYVGNWGLPGEGCGWGVGVGVDCSRLVLDPDKSCNV